MALFISILFHFLLAGTNLDDQYKPLVCTDYKQVQYEVKKNVLDQLKNSGTFIKCESSQHHKYQKRTKRRNLDAIPIFSTNLNLEFLVTIIDFPSQIHHNNFNALSYSLRAPPNYFL